MRSEPPALLPTVPPGQPVQIELRQRSLRRSHQLERAFTLVSMWPLGLLRTRAVVRVRSDLVTEPARVPLHPEVVHSIAHDERSASDRSLLPGPEFHSLREHLPDEDARAVHALRSAVARHAGAPRRAGPPAADGRPRARPAPAAAAPAARRQPPLRMEPRRLRHAAAPAAPARRCGMRVLVLAAEPADLLVRGPAQEVELLTLLAEAQPTPHRPVPTAAFQELQKLPHCYWIPAGSYLAAPEFAAMPGSVTLIGGDLE
jgi:hypothetical protein